MRIQHCVPGNRGGGGRWLGTKLHTQQYMMYNCIYCMCLYAWMGNTGEGVLVTLPIIQMYEMLRSLSEEVRFNQKSPKFLQK